jgi:L-glutamine-phosphate cytidylyltransferase
MRVIIPAAGIGSRLAPFTNSAPKGLVPVTGEPLLWRTLRELRHAGADLVIVVCGHHAGLLRASLLECPDRPELEFVHNPHYAKTNSIVSLALTRAWWDRDICIVDGDVLVSRHLLRRLWAVSDNLLAIDTSKPYREIDMKAELAGGRLLAFGKQLPTERCAGEFFGVSRWTSAGAAELAAAISRRLERNGQQDWYEEAIRDAAAAIPVRAVEAASTEWAEVDRPTDITAAECVVNGWDMHHSAERAKSVVTDSLPPSIAAHSTPRTGGC